MAGAAASASAAAAIRKVASAPRMPAALGQGEGRQQDDSADPRQVGASRGAAGAAARTADLARLTGGVRVRAAASPRPVRTPGAGASPGTSGCRAAGTVAARTAGEGAPGADRARVAA